MPSSSWGALPSRGARTTPQRDLIEFRQLAPADLPKLASFYSHLDEASRLTRFRSRSIPRDAIVAARRVANDGLGLVAIASSQNSGELVIGEALAQRDESGGAVLGLSVSHECRRRGLGSALLWELGTHVAARDVDHLVADVLATNLPMLRLLQRRGAAAIGGMHVPMLRTLVATNGPMPAWPRDGRPHVLVEGVSWLGNTDTEALVRSGNTVSICTADGIVGDPPRCPLLRGGRCPLADGADAVVCSLPPTASSAAELWQAHRLAHPSMPVVPRSADLGR